MKMVGTIVDAHLIIGSVDGKLSLGNAVTISSYQWAGVNVFCFQIIMDTFKSPYNVCRGIVLVRDDDADDSAAIIGNLYRHFRVAEGIKRILFPVDEGIETFLLLQQFVDWGRFTRLVATIKGCTK